MSGSAPSTARRPVKGPLALRVIARLSQACGVIAATMIVVAVLITCQMIFIRFVLNASTIWHTEGVTYLMIAATMLGLPYVQYLRGHVNVDLLPLMLPIGARKALAALVLASTIAIVGVMFWHGYHFWHEAWDWGETSNTPWNPKLWVPYLALPVGFGLYALQLGADFYAMLTDLEAPFGLDADATLADSSAIERAD